MTSVDHFLQLEKCSGFMPAYITQVIRAATAHGRGFGILELLDIYFIIRGVAVILNPEHSGAKQVIVFYEFNKTNGMNLFSSADHFIRSMGINVLDKVR